MIQLAFATALSDGVQLHRVITPAAGIPGAHVLPLGFQDFPEGTTHVVFQTLFTYAANKQENMLRVCRDRGLKIILDIDDFWQVDETHYRYKEHLKNEHAKEVEFCIKNADIVWCASKMLHVECVKLNKNSHYIPNTYGAFNRPAAGQGARFGYVAGAMDHYQDAQLMGPAFKTLNQNKLPGVTVGWCGFQRGNETDNKMRELLTTAGSHFIGEYLPGAPYYWHFNGFDTALAPIQNTKWTYYKSSLKAVEAGIMGCALICSEHAAFADFEHKTNCLKASSSYDWYRHIKQLHKNPKTAFDLSYNLQSYVKEMFNPETWAANRLQTL